MSNTPYTRKYISIFLVMSICILFFLGIDVGEYRRHRSDSQPIVTGDQTFLTDVTIKKGPLSESWIIQMIDDAKKNIQIGVYSFTLPVLREALLRARERGVMVEVIVEKSPFGATSINRETIQFFRENKIRFHESTESQFAFMHAKYMVIDDVWIIETANWTRSSFSSNREFFVIGKDVSILRNLERIFAGDFSGKRGSSEDVRLLVGPTNARDRLVGFLDKTIENIRIYAPSFSDSDMIHELSRLCHEGKDIQLLLALYEDEVQKTEYDSCIQVRYMKKPLHAKVLIRDRESAFIGSFNYTKNSLESNREIGVFVSGREVGDVSKTFESDWQQAEFALR